MDEQAYRDSHDRATRQGGYSTVINAEAEHRPEPSIPIEVSLPMTAAEASAYADFQLAAKRLLQTRADFEAASQWFQKALAKLSDAATAPK